MHTRTNPPMSGSKTKPRASASSKESSWLSLPAPIRYLFDRFPMVTYDENVLPQRVAQSRPAHILHIFKWRNEDLSPNPACLKWQIYLAVNSIPFVTQPSNNHASPAGALPFVLPAISSTRDPIPQAISSSKIHRWAETLGVKEESINLQLEAYSSLIDQNMRNAWLYHLYLQPENFEAVARPLYVDTTSSNTLVRVVVGNQLQAAAKDELLRTRQFIDAEEIYSQVDGAFDALNTLLGNKDFFSGKETPGLFDASLVAYTHLILSFADNEEMTELMWRNTILSDLLSRYDRLTLHRRNVIRFCAQGNAT